MSILNLTQRVPHFNLRAPKGIRSVLVRVFFVRTGAIAWAIFLNYLWIHRLPSKYPSAAPKSQMNSIVRGGKFYGRVEIFLQFRWQKVYTCTLSLSKMKEIDGFTTVNSYFASFC